MAEENQAWVYIAIGMNIWGKAPTMLKALENASEQDSRKSEFILYHCHPKTSISEMGGLCYPEGEHPTTLCKAEKTGKRFYIKELNSF